MHKKTVALSLLLLIAVIPLIALSCSASLVFGGDPRTPGYWKNHPEAWPVESVIVRDEIYTKAQAISLLNGNAKDVTYKLASHLIAGKLNTASGFYGANDPATVWSTIGDADAFLAAHPLGSNPQGAERTYALQLKDSLDSFNQKVSDR